MDLLADVAAWFADPSSWTGTGGVLNRLTEHVGLSIASVLAAVVVAVPLGLAIGHTGRAAFLTVSVASIGRAIPSYALLIVLVPLVGLGFAAAFPALVVLAIPPMLANTYAGMRSVDREVIEAGRGMGMGELELLRRVELPLAMPLVIAGLRIASVQVVATATLAALVAGGGLGNYILDGFALRDEVQLVAGGLLVALLALAAERLFTLLERRITPVGLRANGAQADTRPSPSSSEGAPAA